ncbi:toluene transporter subunit: ATP-binding component of ABC superfamily protein [Legionella quinlivanii]|uniref:Toluene transporter subunit: ATP-binding component of ABC superfamily protein n=1 Tax=Legionella quinlivanii TaxID=45073 RepID=A0A0W0XL43_9GAMM|nr:ATP-binding cassette domain-containing protein [Legionella quinlivanii]KTD45304.1 toluene transporter subunit: ATP-binding component of ABC superfamily protein [Legionella quinlivanii]MCW8450425.1 ATP-binding cassette domain-containing protein [Legionella quinlivanii]SEG02261.1 phospholipid/cholesterol/gamma-HCH transport system ATP-binding protein [Legionella quinlivanii DSM 21216]STY11396.1 toluene transporter subunit: ATP-binding component of ABC superfamily [Legionella quinlivanii]
MQENLVTITNLTFSRGIRQIFNDVNMVVKRGKITAIMGPSGSGKTTLLKLIGAQIFPDQGEIIINGENIHCLPRKVLYQARKKMGLLFQSSALFTHLSVFENVAFPLREHTNLNNAMIRDIVLMKLEAVGLRGAAQMMPAELSGGMARRVALARTIALDPELMMYDEPFTGQDPISMGVLVRLIKQLNELLQTTTIIVSHDVAETCSIADYVYLIAGGRLIGEGTPEELKESQEPQIKQFMHGEADGVVPFHYPARPYTEELLDA